MNTIGRSTIVIVVNDAEDGVIAVDPDEGQRNDAPMAMPELAEAASRPGRIDEMLGDKGFDPDAICGVILTDHDTPAVIFNRANRTEP